MQEIITAAEECARDNDAKGVVALLKPLLKPRREKQLSLSDKAHVRQILSKAHLMLGNNSEGIRMAEEAVAVWSEPCFQHAVSLFFLGSAEGTIALERAHTRLSAAVQMVRDHGSEDLKIADNQQTYACMLLECGEASRRLKRFHETCTMLADADQILKKSDRTAIPLQRQTLLLYCGRLARDKEQWQSAYNALDEACASDTIIVNAKLHAQCMHSLGQLLRDFKQYEMAIDLYASGDACDATISAALAECKQLAAQPHRERIESANGYRLCSNPECTAVEQWMPICMGCCTAWYCSTECQLDDWPQHKPCCHVCSYCEKALDRDAAVTLRCSRCKQAKYCGAECQAWHWREGGHKERCIKTSWNP